MIKIISDILVKIADLQPVTLVKFHSFLSIFHLLQKTQNSYFVEHLSMVDIDITYIIEGDENEESSGNSIEVGEKGPTRRKQKRKALTYQRIIHDIDSALQDENYDDMAPILQKRTITGYLPDPLNKKNKVPIKFVNEKPDNLGRNKVADIIRNKPGLSAYSRNAKSHKEVFSLFLTDDMLLKIVDYTNLRIRNTISKAEAIIQKSDKYIYSLNNHKVSHLFSERHGIPKFNACMSRNRFKFLLNHIAFDNFEDREERWEHDRFSAIREFFEHCNENFAKSLAPEDYLSLDETLYPMRTQIGFKQ